MIETGIQTGCQIGCQPALYYITIIALLTFGILYNFLVGWMEKHHYTEGYTSFLVAVGVIATLLLILPIIGLTVFVILAIAFTCTGIFMIIGHVGRYMRDRRQGYIEWTALLEQDADQDAQELA